MRVEIGSEPLKRHPDLQSAVEIAAAASSTAPASARVCRVLAPHGRRSFVKRIGNVADASANAVYASFKLHVGGAPVSDEPFNNMTSAVGTPAAPGEFWYEVPQGKSVELWGYSTKTTGPINVSAYLELVSFDIDAEGL